MKHQAFIATLMLLLFNACSSHLNPYTDWNNDQSVESDALFDDYHACLSRQQQSFININNVELSESRVLRFKYVKGAETIFSNGDSIQLNISRGNYLWIENHQYELKQLFMIASQESMVKEHGFPLEAHFVHVDEAGHLVVVVVMFEKVTIFNPEIDMLLKAVPNEPGASHSINFSAEDLNNLLPQRKHAYRFDGSQIIPACSGNLQWVVFKQPIEITDEQVEQFKQVTNHLNNRLTEHLN
jgi:carbonic anhydrase